MQTCTDTSDTHTVATFPYLKPMTSRTKPETHLQKFRRHNPRFDYYAMPDAAAAIERLRQLHPDASKRQVIDMLVEEGVKAFFPESTRDAVNSEPE